MAEKTQKYDDYPYSIESYGITNFKFSVGKVKCEICEGMFESLKDLCHSGRFESIYVCESCYEHKKDDLKRLVEEKVSKYSKIAKEILNHFGENSVISATTEPCCEPINSYVRKIRKLNLDFEYDLEISNYNMGIRFKIVSFDDFINKWNKINKAKTRCGCAIMYGDSCTSDVSIMDKNKGSTKDVDFDILMNFTNLQF